MKKPFDRRSFLKIAGTSFGIGVACSTFPVAAREFNKFLKTPNF